MKENISNVWLQFLYDNWVVLSWGISQIAQTDFYLRFRVKGNLYEGFVRIECLEEKFDVLFEKTNSKVERIDLDNLVRVIDENVESQKAYILH